MLISFEIMLNFARNLRLIYDLNLLTVYRITIPPPVVSRDLSYFDS